MPVERQVGRVNSATFDILRKLGITTIFGNPGSTEIPMFRDFPADFHYVLGLQESVVVGMADGYAQAVDNAAIVNLHSAAGLGHALGAVYTAYRNQTPLIVTAGQQARSILPFDAFLSAPSATEFPKPYVKYAVEPARAEDVPQAILRAYQVAMQEPRGPVFISVPVDDWDRTTEFVDYRKVTSTRYPDPAEISKAGRQLADAKNPAILVGAAVDRDNAWEDAVLLAEQQKSSVYSATYANRYGFPHDHPLHMGFLPASRTDIVNILKDHDFILVLGAAVFPYHVEGEGPHIPEQSRLVQITENPELASWAAAGESIVSDLKPAIQALIEVSGVSQRSAPAPRPAAPTVTATDSISDRFLLQTLESVCDPDVVLVEEAPTTTIARQAYFNVKRPHSFVCAASGGLGFGIAAAVGFALGAPEKRVLSLLGDGSSMYSFQALSTAAAENANVTFVIVNNGNYAAIASFAGYFGMDGTPGTDLPAIDFSNLSLSLSVPAERVSDPAKLEEALKNALGADGPNLVEVMVSEGEKLSFK